MPAWNMSVHGNTAIHIPFFLMHTIFPSLLQTHLFPVFLSYTQYTYTLLPFHTSPTHISFNTEGWAGLRGDSLFFTVLLDIDPDAVSHLWCKAFFSHHLILYFLPGYLDRHRPVRTPQPAGGDHREGEVELEQSALELMTWGMIFQSYERQGPHSPNLVLH